MRPHASLETPSAGHESITADDFIEKLAAHEFASVLLGDYGEGRWLHSDEAIRWMGTIHQHYPKRRFKGCPDVMAYW